MVALGTPEVNPSLPVLQSCTKSPVPGLRGSGPPPPRKGSQPSGGESGFCEQAACLSASPSLCWPK